MPEPRDEPQRDDDEIAALLRQVDHPVPPISAEAIIARAAVREVRWARWAAALLIAFGVTGVAYAAPRSPLRGWLGTAIGWIKDSPSPSPSAPPPPPVPQPALAGIAVAPGKKLVIVFVSSQSTGEARVTLTDGPDVVVRAPGGSATFTAGTERLAIDNRGASATFEIEIPRAAPRVEIRVAGTRVLLKQGARITTATPREGSGPYRIPLLP